MKQNVDCLKCAGTYSSERSQCPYCGHSPLTSDAAPLDRKCPRCAETIRTEATACRHCGHDFLATQQAEETREKVVRATRWGCIALILAPVAFALFVMSLGKEKSPAEQAADRRAGFHCLSPMDGSNRDFVRKVQAMLREPDSFEHIETRISPERDGQHFAIMKYRARNGFGGVNVGEAQGTLNYRSCEATVLFAG